ncbi:helix-turn-helix domain-containing protein [Taibaiella soli]|uniref:XRE family transcriptional regulator n=1 Tax=Taibaiella soli TaxID=1649169 RepID=A0A2W2AAU5_9BACT|nr:helix-turn-helix transcriptional regulator [Taibaiella soli]PZF72401.1 XRE family transcriptional regulator [Taibaiella soli]
MASNHKAHHGKNLRKFREWKGWKQEALAFEMGDDWSQKKISLLEHKETIEDAILEQLSSVLKIPVEAFDVLNEEPGVNFINSTFNESPVNLSSGDQNNTFNPLEKWLAALDENKQLYERLLQAEREKVEMLQQLLKNK